MKRINAIIFGLLTTVLVRGMNIPVSLYTGVPEIFIPVFTVEVGDYRLPLTLSYNASGIKVAQEASHVGLGWNVRAGGEIHRVIRGYDDFVPLHDQQKNKSGKRDPYWTDTGAFSGSKLYSEAELRPDGEPDIFQYNFAGYQGTFVAQRGAGAKDMEEKWVLFNTEDNLKIKYENDRFEILAPDGVKYTFAEKKRFFTLTRTFPKEADSFHKAFQTTKAVTDLTPKDKANYDFQHYILDYLREQAPEECFSLDDIVDIYKIKGTSYTQRFFNNMEFLNSAQPFCPSRKHEYDSLLVQKYVDYRVQKGKTDFVPSLLTRVAFGYGETVTDESGESTSDWFLTSIALPSGECIRLSYDVKENSYCSPPMSSQVIVHEMLKDGPAATTPPKVGDMQTGDQSATGLVWKDVTTPPDLQNHECVILNQTITTRDPVLRKIEWDDGQVEFLTNGMLRTDVRDYTETASPAYKSRALAGIRVYSTKSGQLSQMKFHHSFFKTSGAKSGTAAYLTNRLRLDSITVYGTSSTSSVGYRLIYDETASLPLKNASPCDIWGYYGRGTGCRCFKAADDYTSVSGEKYLTAGETYCLYHGIHNEEHEFRDISGTDEEIAKTWTLTDLTNPIGGKTHYEYECHKVLLDNKEETIGGLRVRKVESPAVTQEYIYDTASAKLLRNPPFAYPYMDYRTTNGHCYTFEATPSVSNLKNAIDKLYKNTTYQDSKFGLVFTSQPLQPWESPFCGGYVGYGKVEVRTLGEGDDYQKEVYTFNNQPETSMTRFDKVGSHQPRNGKPATHCIYRKTAAGAYQQVYRTVYTYSRETGKSVPGIVNYGSSLGARYLIYGYRDYLSSTAETLAGTGSSTAKTVKTNYIYNDKNFQLKSVSTQQTDGPIRTQEYTYAVDYPDANRAMGTLNDRHCVNLEVDNATYVNGNLIEKNVFVYDNDTTPHKPSKVFEYTGRASCPSTADLLAGKVEDKPRMSYRYNRKGRLVEFVTRGGQHAVFIWGYCNRHVIAEITGATLDEVRGALNCDLDELAEKTAPSSAEISAIKKLRTALPLAEVVVKEYKPFIGISKQTDDYNHVLNYTYDKQRRLDKITEQKDSKTQLLIEKNIYNYATEK